MPLFRSQASTEQEETTEPVSNTAEDAYATIVTMDLYLARDLRSHLITFLPNFTSDWFQSTSDHNFSNLNLNININPSLNFINIKTPLSLNIKLQL